MSRKKRMSIGRAPLTKEELGGIAKERVGKPITCAKCGRFGGTLIKLKDDYVHQNKELCKLLEGTNV